jgi:hypothetical protein
MDIAVEFNMKALTRCITSWVCSFGRDCGVFSLGRVSMQFKS